MTNFANRTAAVAAFAFVATAFGAVAAQAQEVDSAELSTQTAAFSQDVFADLTDRIAVPTADMEADYEAMGERYSVKPDMSYARAEEDGEPVRMASAR